MATMLGFLTTDLKISSAMLAKALKYSVDDSFNMVSVDGDTSTNDMVSIMANGLAGNIEITEENEDFLLFQENLKTICIFMAKKIAADGEGATKLLECKVKNAPNITIAKTVAKSVITSSLVKTAIFGSDANWGRILCAIGYTEGEFNINSISVYISSEKGKIQVCKNGSGIIFDENFAKEILLEKVVEIEIDLNNGKYDATSWGCDLTYNYVKINGDYRS